MDIIGYHPYGFFVSQEIDASISQVVPSSSIPRNFCQPNSAASGKPWVTGIQRLDDTVDGSEIRLPVTSGYGESTIIYRVSKTSKKVVFSPDFWTINSTESSLEDYITHLGKQLSSRISPTTVMEEVEGDMRGYILDPRYGDLPGKKWTHFIVLPKGSRGGRREVVVWGRNPSERVVWNLESHFCLFEKGWKKALVSRISLIYLMLDLSYLKYPEFVQWIELRWFIGGFPSLETQHITLLQTNGRHQSWKMLLACEYFPFLVWLLFRGAINEFGGNPPFGSLQGSGNRALGRIRLPRISGVLKHMLFSHILTMKYNHPLLNRVASFPCITQTTKVSRCNQNLNTINQ